MTTKGYVRACPQIKEASMQTDVTSKRYANALIHKLGKQANMTTMGHVRACPQIWDASKQTDVSWKRHAKALVVKLWKRANMATKDM